MIAYIGGYCCYSINKKLKCEECKLRIVSSDGNDTSFNYSLIKGIRRGSLLYPNADILHIGLISYIVIQKIACFDEFLRSNSQRALSVNSILATQEDEVLLLDFLALCSPNHESIQLVKISIYTCVNILLNNYCFIKTMY